MASIESAVVRVVVDVSESLADRLSTKVEPIDFSVPEAEELLNDLGNEATKLLRYLDSPDFAAVAARYRVRSWLGTHAEDQVRRGLRLTGLPKRFLDQATQVVRQVLTLACEEVAPLFHEPSSPHRSGHVGNAAVTSSRMLAGLKSLTRFHDFAARICDQVTALHNSIRLPHVGVSRAVRYDQLYVQPGVDSPDRVHLGAPGDRTVILGDPGSGMSTFAAKFAHDIAGDGSGRVPFLMVLREFAGTFDQGGHDLLHYLEMLCRAPYNVKAPPGAIEYLLRTERSSSASPPSTSFVPTARQRNCGKRCAPTSVSGKSARSPFSSTIATSRTAPTNCWPRPSPTEASTSRPDHCITYIPVPGQSGPSPNGPCSDRHYCPSPAEPGRTGRSRSTKHCSTACTTAPPRTFRRSSRPWWRASRRCSKAANQVRSSFCIACGTAMAKAPVGRRSSAS